MFYDIALKPVGIALGLLLIAGHIVALIMAPKLKPFLETFPRNKMWGIIILLIDTLWAFWLVKTMDMGEFYKARNMVLIAIPILFVLVVLFVDEFLSVRALGTLLLLAACPILNAAWFEDTSARLLLPILAYIWIFFGLFWVGKPYLMRDQIGWITEKVGRWKGACIGGIIYGALMLICAIAFY